MSVVIWRDSVAMGDDADAPHEWGVPIQVDASVGSLVGRILERGYLARIGGGLATWIIEGRRPVAVVAQQWAEARWLVDAETPIRMVMSETEGPAFQARYWCQVDPERVYACLRAGEPLPDRYGR